jgi:hypothetical protein
VDGFLPIGWAVNFNDPDVDDDQILADVIVAAPGEVVNPDNPNRNEKGFPLLLFRTRNGIGNVCSLRSLFLTRFLMLYRAEPQTPLHRFVEGPLVEAAHEGCVFLAN